MILKLHTFVHRQNHFQQTLGHWIAWGSLSLVVISALVVLLRYGFDTGSIALQESLIYNHATLFMFGMAYALQQDKHVRVDVFYANKSENYQTWVNLLGAIFFALPSMLFILWSSWHYVNASWTILETSSEPGGLPFVYLLKTVIWIMAILMSMQITSLAIASWLKLFHSDSASLKHSSEELDDSEAKI